MRLSREYICLYSILIVNECVETRLKSGIPGSYVSWIYRRPMTMSTGNFCCICWNDGETRSTFSYPLLNYLFLLMVALVDFLIVTFICDSDKGFE